MLLSHKIIASLGTGLFMLEYLNYIFLSLLKLYENFTEFSLRILIYEKVPAKCCLKQSDINYCPFKFIYDGFEWIKQQLNTN